MALLSFRAFNFADNHFDVWRPVGARDYTVNANYITGGVMIPQFGGITLAPRVLHYVAQTQPGYDLETQRQTLERGLRVDLNTLDTLVETRADGTQVEHLARLQTIQTTDNVAFDLIFEVADPYWTSSTPASQTVTGPALAGGSVQVSQALSGTVRARPLIKLTPLLDKTGGVLPHSLPVTVAENSGHDLTAVPWTVTFDHATAVTAGKSLSDGSDILVKVGGAYVDRSITAANTASCRVTFPLTVAASSAAAVEILYASTGQLYGGGTYAQDGTLLLVSERSGNALTNYPYRVQFDHAAAVTAGYSRSSGADIRVWLDGVEVDRAISGANTTTCSVWFPLTVGANANAVVAITLAASGYDFAGTTFTNGALDLSASTNAAWIYTTPNYTLNDDTPGKIKPILARINTSFALPSAYVTSTGLVGSDPADIVTLSGGTTGGNALRLYAGGVPLTDVRLMVTYRNGAAFPGKSMTRIGQSADLSTWTSAHDFAQNWSTETSGGLFATYSLAAGTTAVALIIERANATAPGASDYAKWHGSGSSELQLTPDGTQTPSNASLTTPSNTAGSETFSYVFSGFLQDFNGRFVNISNLTPRPGGGVAVDCATRTAYLIDVSGVQIDDTGLEARRAIIVSSPDEEWLAGEPGTTLTVEWVEDHMDADGMQMVMEISDRWL